MGHGVAPVAAKRAWRDLYPGRSLTPLVFIAVYHTGNAPDILLGQSRSNDIRDRLVPLNVALKNVVKDRIGREGILISLVGSKFS